MQHQQQPWLSVLISVPSYLLKAILFNETWPETKYLSEIFAAAFIKGAAQM